MWNDDDRDGHARINLRATALDVAAEWGTPPSLLGRKKTAAANKIAADLVQKGWRIVPFPQVIRAGVLWNDGAGDGSPAMTSYRACEWKIFPPGSSRHTAQVRGRLTAIRLAYKMARETPTTRD